MYEKNNQNEVTDLVSFQKCLHKIFINLKHIQATKRIELTVTGDEVM